MKAILTFVFFIFISTTAMANTKEVKVEAISKSVNLEITVAVKAVKNTEVARLYKFKNSRVKKALKFSTKANRAKMA
ncbi:MAG: hypothetical protein AAGC45_02855 [Bacteroidota bacterium]